jgi:predicted phage tail protein
MFGAFAAAMIVGASGFIAASFSGQMATGVFFFVSMALFGAGVLFVGVLQHSDNERTAADYRAACAQTNARNTKRA